MGAGWLSLILDILGKMTLTAHPHHVSIPARNY